MIFFSIVTILFLSYYFYNFCSPLNVEDLMSGSDKIRNGRDNGKPTVWDDLDDKEKAASIGVLAGVVEQFAEVVYLIVAIFIIPLNIPTLLMIAWWIYDLVWGIKKAKEREAIRQMDAEEPPLPKNYYLKLRTFYFFDMLYFGYMLIALNPQFLKLVGLE